MSTTDTAAVAGIVSGGQTGVDRAALDFAIAAGVPYGGWVPKNGRAEDGIDLLGIYPRLREMATADHAARSRQNVADSTATLVVCPAHVLSTSPGTLLTVRFAHELGRPYLVSAGTDPAAVRAWVAGLGQNPVLNVAGPRGSHWNEGYAVTRQLLAAVLGVE
jgi:hypothetical protein